MRPFRLSKIKYLFLGGLIGWAFHRLPAQEWSGETIHIRSDSLDERQATITQTFYLKHPYGDTIYLYNWLHSYAHIRSSLAGVLADRYRLDFLFSSPKQRGRLQIDSLNVEATIEEKGDLVRIIPRRPLTTLRLYYRVRWPDRRYTGIGLDKTGFDLREMFLQPVPRRKGRLLKYNNIDLNDRPSLAIPVEIMWQNPPRGYYWQSNAAIDSSRGMLRLRHTHNRIYLAGRTKPFRVIRSGHHQWILAPEVWKKASLVQLALAVDRTAGFLQDFPLAGKILITDTDLRQFPVYDVNGVPVIKPFPPAFGLQTGIFYQTVRQSLSDLPRDYRRDYGFWSGLEQWYLMRFVDTYFPRMRLTGMPVHWPVIRLYRLFQVPYNYKYYYIYRYIAGMNYDQALRLPADSLSPFNLKAGTPSKSALGWKILEDYAGRPAVDSVLSQLYAHPAPWPGVFDSLWKARRLPDISFLWGDFYRTARKIDFTLKRKGRRADSVIVRVRNKGGVRFPVFWGDSTTPPLLFAGRDTLVRWPAVSLPVRINRAPLYPEINKRNNTVPAYRKPLRIRFWQDMEDPFARQLFVNPSVNYNLYDGLLMGMELTNKTFLDKNFMWRLRPFYGLRSHSVTGQGGFRYIHRTVRPYFFGWSVGGYYKTYHYNFGRLYRSASLFGTLSFKDRKARFLKGQDWNAEILYVDKDAPRPDETTRYTVGVLKHQWQMRGLLKRYRWENEVQVHARFVKLSTDFRWRSFIDKYRQLEWRVFAGWMPYNRTSTGYFAFSLSRPTDYLFKYRYYGRSETSGIFAQQYVYADGAFKVFYPDGTADKWILTNNVYIGLYKRFNWFVDFGWTASRGRPPRFHYDTGLRVYLVPDYFELYFPVYSDLGPVPFDRSYWSYVRIMFVFDLPGLMKMLSRSWY